MLEKQVGSANVTGEMNNQERQENVGFLKEEKATEEQRERVLERVLESLLVCYHAK